MTDVPNFSTEAQKSCELARLESEVQRKRIRNRFIFVIQISQQTPACDADILVLFEVADAAICKTTLPMEVGL